VASHAAELSSLQSQLDELIARIYTMAREVESTPRDDLLATLYEIERALRTARSQAARAAGLV
jgi:hypothetical protein